MQKLLTETIQHKTDVCCALTQGDYTHRHNQGDSIVHQELPIKCGLSKGPPMPYYRYEPQSVLEKSNYKVYYARTIITDRTVHHNRADSYT
jgi:hypothetical protein